jgi:prepilin-type N-terminal cleavage/methylation domain-containing protein
MIRKRKREGERRGMALLEVMIALTILAAAVLSAGAHFTKLARGVSDERTRAQALSLVGQRFEQVKTAPTYGGVDSIYAGVESAITGYPGYQRRTDVTRVGGSPSDFVDYKIVTVTVTTPAIPRSVVVSKSLVISDF